MVLIGKEKMVSACKNTVIIYNPRDGPIKEREKAYIFHSKACIKNSGSTLFADSLFLFKSPSIQQKFKPGLYVPFVIILQFNQNHKVLYCVSGVNAYSWLLSGSFLRFSSSIWMENFIFNLLFFLINTFQWENSLQL